MKICTRCKRTLAFSCFPTNKTCAGGVTSTCKRCKEIEYREKNGFPKRICLLEKPCRVCGETKPLNTFPKRKNSFDGHETRCKKCVNKQSLRSNEVKRRSYKKLKNDTARYNKHKKRMAEQNKRRRMNPEVRISKRVSEMMRRALKGTKANKKTWDILDYSAEELRKHLEMQFIDGMNWDKFLNGEIHIDHIVPQSSFKFNSCNDESFKHCWSLSNLRPLWADDNIRKSNRQDFLI